MSFSEKLKNITLYVFVVYIINALMEITVFNSISGLCQKSIIILRYLCYILFVLKVVYDIFTERKISAVVLGLVAISGVVVIVTSHMRLGAVILVITAMRNIDTDKIIKYVMYALSVFFAIIVILALLNIIPDWQYQRDNVTRHSLGFHYPTDAYSIYLTIAMMYIYSFRKKLSFIVLGILTALNIVLFYLTEGRLSFILTTLVIVFGFGYKVFEKFKKPMSAGVKKVIKIVCICLPIVLTAVAFLGVMLYSNGSGIGTKLNSALSDRLLYSSNAIKNYPITPFGTQVEWFGWGGFGFTELEENFNYNFVDISYIRMLFDYGIIMSIIIVALYTLLLKDLCKKGDYVTVFIIVVVLLWSFVEPYIFSLSRNIFVILFIPYLEYGTINLKRHFAN